MKTERQIRARITEIQKDYAHVLKGSTATVWCNAPRALLQTVAESSLTTLYWMLDETYQSKLKGTDR